MLDCIVDRISEVESKLEQNELLLGRRMDEFQHKYKLLR